MREAARDDKTLARLENDLKVLSLEKAREEEPWELITNPTLFDNPIAPRRKQQAAVGLFSGFLLGCGLCLLKENRKNLVYSENGIESILELPSLGKIKTNLESDENIKLLSYNLNKDNSMQKISIIPAGSINIKDVEKLAVELNKGLKEKELIVTKDLIRSAESNSQIIVLSIGLISREQLKTLKNMLDLQGGKLEGWIELYS